MNNKQQREAARSFANKWKGRGYEKGESQVFWLELLNEVFGIDSPGDFIKFEDKVMLDNASFIDGYIPSTKVMIEQKSLDKDLKKAIRQSDGSMLTPFQQAKRYVAGLPVSRHPRWVVVSNFERFLVYDMEQPNGEPEEILLADLPKEYYRLRLLVDNGSALLQREMEVSMQAGEIIGEIYDELLEQYGEHDELTLRQLNILCVRLVFCLYAEDAGIFNNNALHDYLETFKPVEMREALLQLFDTLNTPIDQRSRYLRTDLQSFPYTNGGLFAEKIDVPQFTPKLRTLILKNASLDFDWSEISPTIFGAVFESTLNPETRRAGGMHYTSIENIHKVIDPLFLNDLNYEFSRLKDIKVEKSRRHALLDFQNKLASLTFLDPACGSGNFLTETYLSLRRLENRVVNEIYKGASIIGFEEEELSPIKVNINQFYGIEINDFAVTVATTALWISEAQMLAETERIIRRDIDFLPLKSYTNIHEGNALRTDWNDVIPASCLNYIIGNPPFVGARLMSKDQKDDLLTIFGKKWKNIGNMDYVTGWYKKAADMMHDTHIRAALVSTNSVTQGEQVANLWRPLVEENGVVINFAYPTFRWDSEASLKAHVHCVIIGFSTFDNNKEKILFNSSDNAKFGKHLNPYLFFGDDVWIGSRQHPVCDVSEISIGNQPIDGGNYLFSDEEKDEFLKQEPKAEKYFKKWYGAQEFIHQRPRYCLWLGDCSPAELRSMPHSLKRVENVRKLRLESTRTSTIKLADRPTRFQVENMPDSSYIIIPSTSSENRRYIPIGFMDKEAIASNAVHIIPEATLYHFGVLESNVHMAWMRAVCGRLKSDYRYSKDVVYNNFPWPEPTNEQRLKIESTARAILDARDLYPDSSLADLYDELTMPAELRHAHQANDRAVMEAYGMPWRTMTESECVAYLFKLYKQLINKRQ